MKYPTIAILGVVILAVTAGLWVTESIPPALVAILFVLGLAVTATGVILFNNSRIKRIRQNDRM